MGKFKGLWKIAGLLLALSGLTFWFVQGFPFANHNESYLFAAQLRSWSVLEVLTKQLYPVANLRPLGQALAWVLFKLGGETALLAQLFNFACALAAWSILYVKSREKIPFAIAALFSTGFFFSGYIYLFHLHGVFYGPLLITTASMIISVENPVTVKKFIIISLGTLFAALFHVYALFLYAAYIFSVVLERKRVSLRRKHWLIVAVGAAACIFLIIVLMIIPRAGTALGPKEMFGGLVASYAMTDISRAVSAMSLLFSLSTFWSVHPATSGRPFLTIALLFAGIVMDILGVPVLLLWVFLCLAKALEQHRPTLAFLLLTSALFPAPAATGSPTYVIFALMVCTYTTVKGWTEAQTASERISTRLLFALPALIIIVSIVARTGVDFPILSKLTSPLVAERERTVQMETIIDWYAHSAYADRQLQLLREGRNPVDAGLTALDRHHRPPLDQMILDLYLQSLRPEPGSAKGKLMVMFGNDSSSAYRRIVYSVSSPHAGTATVADSVAAASLSGP